MDNPSQVRRNRLRAPVRPVTPPSTTRRRNAAAHVRQDKTNNTNNIRVRHYDSAPPNGFTDVVERGLRSLSRLKPTQHHPQIISDDEQEEIWDEAPVDPQFTALEAAAQKLSQLLSSYKYLPVPNGSPAEPVALGFQAKQQSAHTISEEYNEQAWDKTQLDRQLTALEAAEELWKRPKTGEIYGAVTADVELIHKRLEDLSVNGEDTIDVGMEIADAVNILKLMSKSNAEIDMAAQKARRGAFLMLQGTMMTTKGGELLAESKRMLQPNNQQ